MCHVLCRAVASTVDDDGILSLHNLSQATPPGLKHPVSTSTETSTSVAWICQLFVPEMPNLSISSIGICIHSGASEQGARLAAGPGYDQSPSLEARSSCTRPGVLFEGTLLRMVFAGKPRTSIPRLHTKPMQITCGPVASLCGFWAEVCIKYAYMNDMV